MTAQADIINPAGLSIPGIFEERARRSPDAPAYRFFDGHGDRWRTLSWRQCAERVGRWQAALQQEGLAPGERVGLMLPNGVDWLAADLAAQSLGLVVVPLYANDRPDNIAYILDQTEARLLFCLQPVFEHHLSAEKTRLDRLQTIVTTGGAGRSQVSDGRIQPLEQWLPAQGEMQTGAPRQPDDLATIVYTSGTTGRPKGVMLSHRNILENAAAGLQCLTVYPDDVFLSFLPLSHMLERTAGYYLPILAGSTVAFARSIQELAEDLETVRPTVLVAVPRIFEKLHTKLLTRLRQESPLKQRLFHQATRIGWHRFQYRQGRASWSADFLLQPLLDRLVGGKVRDRLGGRLRIVISGGAPLPLPVARDLIGLGLPIYQGYGLTETSPIISVNRPENNSPDSVGQPLPGIETRIGDNGELLVRGPNVMLGYWNNPEATSSVADADGWLHTGDTARLEDGRLVITGRLKDIMVLSNGEKVSPADVENAIASDPLFEQSLVVGEGRPYLTLLAVLNPEIWQLEAASLGVPADETTLNDATVRSLVLRRVEHCLRQFPGFAWVKDIHLSLRPWTVEEGFLTPTMKVRRKNILAALHDEVERMYQT